MNGRTHGRGGEVVEVLVGTFGASALVRVDAHGSVHARRWSVDWWIGAEGAWRTPATAVGCRQTRLGAGPAVETAVRVAGGDVRQRVHAVASPVSPDGLVVVDVENASPAPVAVAIVASARNLRRGGTATMLDLGGHGALVMPRPPGRWAAASRPGGTWVPVSTGGARDDALDPGRCSEVALVFPVPHRTTMRVVLVPGRPTATPPDPAALPPVEASQRGWDAQLARGLRLDVPHTVREVVDAARATALLLASAGTPRADTVAALEDWGFDAEAAHVWRRLSTRARRRAARRLPAAADRWGAARDALRAVTPGGGFPGGPEVVLRAVRDVVLDERDDRVDVLPGFPSEWLGQPVAVHDAPTRHGPVSFALRWHGRRPALLWEAPSRFTVRAPALDPGWIGGGGSGEVLLAEPPMPLMAMGEPAVERGESVVDPGSFA